MVQTRINIHMDNFDDHAKDILKDVYENSMNCDIALVAGKKKFMAHKAVLAFTSDFLKEIIEESTCLLPGNTIIISIPEVDPEIIEHILTFIYTGEARIKEDVFLEFANVCSMLQLKNMVNFEQVKDEVASQAHRPMEEEHAYIEDVTIIDDYAEIVKSVTEEETSHDVVYETSMVQDTGNYEVEVIEYANAEDETKFTPPPLKKFKPQSNTLREGDPMFSEALQGAMNDILYNKLSFNAAAEKYNISKSILWRKCHQSPEYQLQKENPANEELNQTILEELKNGETLLSISKKYNIPVSTLHRRKSLLFEKGELPENVRIKQRNRGEDFPIRLEQAIKEIERGISQTEAAKKYRIPKTTIWRRLKRSMNPQTVPVLNAPDQTLPVSIKTEIESEQMSFEV